MTGTKPRLVCLLPARNCALDLPEYFASVLHFADAVVALDDGSTDETREILRSHPLVDVMLTNPRRDTYAGWNDLENRNRLLAAADALDPDWIMSLDADERIVPEDGILLREFVETQAQRGTAYLFRVFRMIGSPRYYDHEDLWVGRLFSYEREQAQVFPHERLHFVPIPTSIPRSRWRKTSIRIQHLAGASEQRRRDRFQKYVAADPDRDFQSDYEHLLEPPGPLKQWEPRPPALPVEHNTALHREAEEAHGSDPAFSVVVVSGNGDRGITRTLRSIVTQPCSERFEVIVVTNGSRRPAELENRIPGVRVLEVARPTLPAQARNAGLRAARGRYVWFLGPDVEVPPGSLSARLRAHHKGYAMVTGTVLNGTRTWVGWAAHFLDETGALVGHPSGRLPTSLGECSYVRETLVHIGGFPEDLPTGTGEVVNRKLFMMGYGAYRAEDVCVIRHMVSETVLHLLVSNFRRGRTHGMTLVAEAHSDRKRFLDRRMVRYVLVGGPGRLRWITRTVHRSARELRLRYWLAFPLVAAAALTHWLGGCYELMLSWLPWRRERRAARTSSTVNPRTPATLPDTIQGTLTATRQRSPRP
jgi:glycosyltransferase involved in cell wall biosynthesis